ncbi:MAG: hypothetical protein GY796_34980, partial [Chloroflexi bacterium]|nr:hypothetical protein [Chloroflexota bacterium]
AASLSITLPTVEYYDFRHPNATNLMLIAEAQYGSGSDSFDVNLPVSLTYYERSWSINCQHWWGQYYLNDVLIIQVGCPGSNSIWENTEGIFTQVELPPDIYNTIRMDSGGGNVFGGLALVYMVP